MELKLRLGDVVQEAWMACIIMICFYLMSRLVTSVFIPRDMTFYRTRSIALAVISLIMGAYGLSAGRTEWTLRSDGSVVNAARQMSVATRYIKPVFTMTFGLGNLYTIVNSVTSISLLIGAVLSKAKLVLPALVLTSADVVSDLSDAMVATALIAKHIGFLEALMYSTISSAIIMFETFLWFGVLKFYERNVEV